MMRPELGGTGQLTLESLLADIRSTFDGIDSEPVPEGMRWGSVREVTEYVVLRSFSSVEASRASAIAAQLIAQLEAEGYPVPLNSYLPTQPSTWLEFRVHIIAASLFQHLCDTDPDMLERSRDRYDVWHSQRAA